jgi:preprotein translocase subunit SecA
VMFQELNRAIREEVVALLFHAQITAGDGPEGSAPQSLPVQPGSNGGGALSYEHETTAGAQAIAAAGGVGTATGLPSNGNGGGGNGGPAQTLVKSEQESIGRNDPCWCGSGKKYKRCHGQ